MLNREKQRGLSFLGWIIIIAVVGFFLMVGVKLFPVYYKGLTTKAIVEDTAAEMEGKGPNKNQLWNKIQKRLDIDSIYDVKKEHFVFEKVKDSINFGVDYEVRIPLIANIDVVAKFDQRQTINGKAVNK